MYDNKKTLLDLNLDHKRVVVRFDFNVPVKDGKVTNDKRIVAALPTIKYLLEHHCSIIGLSHLSRIKTYDDVTSNKKSLKPVAEHLQKLLPNTKVMFESSTDFNQIQESVKKLTEGQILILENTRYYDVNDKNEVIKWESKNNPKLAQFYASLGQAFVNDAFGTAHRAHASNAGIASNLKDSCIGFLVEKEIKMISKAIDHPVHPYVAIMGGAKVSDKIKLINNLLTKADKILIGGGMVYTFKKAQGCDIGSSICEDEMLDTAKELLKKGSDKIVLSTDALCAKEYADVPGTVVDFGSSFNGLQGLDIGPKSINLFYNVLKDAKTVIWNGPCGVTEFKNYTHGTYEVAKTLVEITQKGAFTLIGGGDSAAAVIDMGFKETDFSFISTGGGASLTLIEGSPLVGIDPIAEK